MQSQSSGARGASELERAAVQWSSTLRVDGDTYVQSYRDDKGSDLQRVEVDGKVTRVLSNGPSADVQCLGRVSESSSPHGHRLGARVGSRAEG